MWADLWTILRHATVLDALDIVIIAVFIYYALLLIKDTRAYQPAIGLLLVGVVYLLTVWGRLSVSNRIIRTFVNYVIIAVIVLFQGEIRRFLAGIGSRSFKKPFALRSLQEKMEDLFYAIDYMSQKKIGGLIAIEKEMTLSNYADRGVKIGALLSKALLVSIFFPHSPLHDGAVVVQGDQIVAAGCLLPHPAAHKLSSPFQTRTRHLAALGLSEETGQVSLAVKGRLERFEDSDAMRKRLVEYLRDE